MPASRAILLPTGMAMTFSLGRPTAPLDPASTTRTRDDVDLEADSRARGCVVAIRDGQPLTDED